MRTASERAQTSCARQHPFAGDPTVGCPFDGQTLALSRYLTPLVTSRRRVCFALAGEPTHTLHSAPLVSSRRPERARCLASTSANDGCLVHPMSRFESRPRRRLLRWAFLAVGSSHPRRGETARARPTLGPGGDRVGDRGRWAMDVAPSSCPFAVTPVRGAMALRTRTRCSGRSPRKIDGWRHAPADPEVVWGAGPSSQRMARDVTREECLSAFASKRLRRTRAASRPGSPFVRPELGGWVPASKRRPPCSCAFGVGDPMDRHRCRPTDSEARPLPGLRSVRQG